MNYELLKSFLQSIYDNVSPSLQKFPFQSNFMPLRQLTWIAARPTFRHLHAVLPVELLPVGRDVPRCVVERHRDRLQQMVSPMVNH